MAALTQAEIDATAAGLGPLAAVIDDTLRTTPVQLADEQGIADLVGALTVRVALHLGPLVTPPTKEVA